MDKGVDLGLVLPMHERPDDGGKPTWADISTWARRGEELGADTVWLADEILWRVDEWPGPRGWWDCLAMTGAVAASTSKVRVGTWVMSALQHRPGMIVRAAEALDEISEGRFVLGLGAGHGGGAESFGYPVDKPVTRYLAAHTRCTVDLLSPSAAAILRHDQCVDPSEGFCCVLRAMRACTAASATRGWLPLCSGSRPSMPLCSNLCFQREIVGAVVCNVAMICR